MANVAISGVVDLRAMLPEVPKLLTPAASMFDGNGSEQIYSLITTPYDFVQPAHAYTSKSVPSDTLNGTPAVRALSNLHSVPPCTIVYTQMFSRHIISR
jgi:hypothetical protein